ncbi:uncharacterized protein LOC124620094 [Schistocerca americana]|uniref:uncharacterized protein LOC124620094 n=1 Tax=Schistocerca americana TaxID=7009 RepID=UPI001F4FD136|nr:uncharacterized protein LOC124620094 [Schistocerca americana]
MVVNNTTIDTDSTLHCFLALGLQRYLPWIFTVTNFTDPIIRANFIGDCYLLPDIASWHLIDSDTSRSTKCTTYFTVFFDVKWGAYSGPFADLLVQFPVLIHQSSTPLEARHSTIHYINTSPRPPVFHEPWVLVPHKIKIAKAEFYEMLAAGMLHPSKNLTEKKCSSWRQNSD